MFARFRQKISEWCILGIGLCVVAGDLFVASYQASTPSAASPPVERNQESQGAQPAPAAAASHRPQPPASANPAASPQSSAAAARPGSSAPAQSAAGVTTTVQAPGPSPHDHNMQIMAASEPSPPATSGQASLAPAGGSSIASST